MMESDTETHIQIIGPHNIPNPDHPPSPSQSSEDFAASVISDLHQFTNSTSSLNVNQEDEPYSVENLEREITSLLNQNSSSPASSPPLPVSFTPNANQLEEDGHQIDLNADTIRTLGLNLSGLAAMLQAAQSAESNGREHSAFPQDDGEAQPGTRPAPSFHSLTADQDGGPSLKPHFGARKRGIEDTGYLYQDSDQSDVEDAFSRALDSDDPLLDSCTPPRGSSPTSPSVTDQGTYDDVHDISHDLFSRYDSDHSTDPEACPVVSRSSREAGALTSHPKPVQQFIHHTVPQPQALASTSSAPPPPPFKKRTSRDKDKPLHACEVEKCSKAFTRKSDLNRHMRIHSGDRPFVCSHNDCGKAFIQRSALQVHLRVHTGEKPHSCEYPGCGKTFGDSSSLARHRRTHTGKRPYKCEEPTCDKTFTRRTTLTQHMRTHDPDWEPDPNIRYNFKSTKKQKLDTDDDDDDDEGDLEDSVRTITAIFNGHGDSPPAPQFAHYTDTLQKHVADISAEIVAAITHANPPRSIQQLPRAIEEEPQAEDDFTDDEQDQEPLTPPSMPPSSAVPSILEQGKTLDSIITDVSTFSVPLRARKTKDPIAGIGVKRKR